MTMEWFPGGILVFGFILLSFFLKETLQGQNERHLLHFLFKEKHYNPLERPVANESKPIIIKFGITLQQIIDIDEKNQILYSNIWLQMKWQDVNLVWEPREFGGMEEIRVPAKNVWKPDVLLYNSADDDFDGTYHSNIIVNHQGHVKWIPPGMFKSTCQIDIAWFPFDEQKCDLKFGSWTYDGRFLDLIFDGNSNGDASDFIRNGEWELLGVPGVRNQKSYECCPEIYIDITYTVHVQRRTLYYGFNIIIPCVLISSMSLLLFMLPPDSGEKISLGKQRVKSGVTILLSLMVFLLLVAETMPPTSDAVPLIGIYFCCIMIMCSMSMLFTVIVLNFHYRGPDTHRIPSWVNEWINGRLAWLLWMKRPGPTHIRHPKDAIERTRLHDIVVQERQSSCLLSALDEDIRVENGTLPKPGESPFHNTRSDLLCILRELRKITSRSKREEEEVVVRGEWRFAAMVIDRLCLWICVTFTLISTLAVLFSAPHLVTI
ncbi:neuronal acetylcholine receptor subunit alpha-7-like isoform X1 [Crassostrea virginica]